MKRTLFAIAFILTTICINAQGIYTKVTKYDKFDDVVWTKQIKTLITKTDSTIVIETKGSKPEVYLYMELPIFADHTGSRDSVVNLTADVWGYQSDYWAIPQKLREEAIEQAVKEMENQPDSLVSEDKLKISAAMKMLGRISEMPFITFRYISKYSWKTNFAYKTDIAWIKYPDGSRLIYTKDY